MSDQPPFFIAGGPLAANTPSYVVRPADQELLDNVVRDGAFCYVLTARQMGKSSLMVRAASQLRDQDFTIALVDLARIDALSADGWYLALLMKLKQQLNLTTDVQAWWRGQPNLSAPQRFFDFLHDLVLSEVPGNIVLFVDEIDSMLRLNFRDDFFAAIRAVYNARASDPVFERLTFVVLGVATPLDLIKDATRTPFNIGRAIELHEFDYADATPLRTGLESRHHGQGDRILKRIFHWTNGHPYLTQKLCLVAARARVSAWDDAQVDRLVDELFFSPAGELDPNLRFVQGSITRTPDAARQQMLRIYAKVYRGKKVADDEGSAAQNHLELSGLVGVADGTLRVSNEIYRRVFDKRWFNKLLPKRSHFLIPIALVLIGALAASGYAFVRSGTFTGGQPTAIASALTANPSATSAPPNPTDIVAASAVPGTTELIDTSTPTVPPTESATPTAGPTDTATPTARSTDTPTSTTGPTNTPTSTTGPTNTPTPPLTSQPAAASCRALSAVNLRYGPGNNYSKIPDTALNRGDTFPPLGRFGTSAADIWVAVPLENGGMGWVYNSFVSCTADITKLPPLPTPPPR